MPPKENKPLNFKVVGCGGIGTWLLSPLCTYLSYQSGKESSVHLIDGDDFEDRNRERQLFDAIGNKADVKANELRDKFPSIFFSTTSDFLTTVNIPMLVKDGDIVMCCVDNHATRKLISDHCEKFLENVVLISGGNDYTDGNVQVFIRKDGKNLTQPVASMYHPEIQNPEDKNPGEAQGCMDLLPGEPQLVITNNLVAAHMLCALYGVLTDVFEGTKKYDEAYLDVPSNKASTRTRN